MTALMNIVILALAALLTVSCKDKKGMAKDAGENKDAPPSLMELAEVKPSRIGPFEIGWNPETGKGPVAQDFDDGSRIEICFQCGYKGYTGGLVIGSFNTPGFSWIPSRPVRGFTFLNMWCAFDETLHETATGDNYTFGWSQNFDERHEGKRLALQDAKIIGRSESGIVLGSTNEGGCYRVDRFVSWKRGDRFVVFSMSVQNRCDENVRFDYWLGEDPWIGTYKSSEGDVGWVQLREGEGSKASIVRQEKRLDGELFECAGVYDLGNVEAGDVEGGFSNQANFIRLSPLTPRPTVVYFANRFAHEDADITPDLPLNNKTLTAFNIGWKGIELGPGEKLALGWAAGVAETSEPPSPPSCPEVPYESWFPFASSSVVFESENVSLEIVPAGKGGGLEGRVRGEYFFYSATGLGETAAIVFPFFESEGLDYPHAVSVKGTQSFDKKDNGIAFPVHVAGKERTKIEIEYVQKIMGCTFGYVTTSALRWAMPVKSATFSIALPGSLEKRNPSVPEHFSKSKGGDTILYVAEIDNFVPREDVVVSWDCR
jgi:hypothetical protein